MNIYRNSLTGKRVYVRLSKNYKFFMNTTQQSSKASSKSSPKSNHNPPHSQILWLFACDWYPSLFDQVFDSSIKDQPTPPNPNEKKTKTTT